MKTFIRAVEAWAPSADGSLLDFAGGLYGQATQFGALSRSMCFGRGEGLPGRAWDEGRPLLLKQFEGSYFRRTAAAEAAGWTCAIALPVFLDEVLSAVLVFFCGDDEAHAGAIELWRNDPRITGDMTLDAGYYGTTPKNFESLSRETFLPRGSGLPGMAWQRGEAVFIKELGQAKRFLRAPDAAKAGLQRGLAFPCATRTQETFVMAFLSAASTPIARRIECWAPDADGDRLQRVFGDCEQAGGLSDQASSLPLKGPGSGALGRVFASGAPALVANTATEGSALGAAAAAADLGTLVAIPVVTDGVVSEAVVLYF
jgi:hypothetical protein